MRDALLKLPPVYVPAMLILLAVPDAPADPGIVSMTCEEAPAAMEPSAKGKGVPDVVPILTVVSETLFAAEPPVLVKVSVTTMFPPVRVIARVITRLALVGVEPELEPVPDPEPEPEPEPEPAGGTM